MPLTYLPFSVPVKNGQPICCLCLCRPSGRRDVYCSTGDIKNLSGTLYQPMPDIPAGMLQDWEMHTDEAGTTFYALSVLMGLLPLRRGNTAARERLLRLIQIATKIAETIKS